MAEIGSIIEGKVVKLLKYGVIVELPEGESGLVHISEIDNNFIQDVSDYFRENDQVEVKVIGIDDKGRLQLSVRQAQPDYVEMSRPPSRRRHRSREELDAFEDKLSGFMKQSSERLLDLKRNIEAKRGGRRR
jgi:S1 RNA binding domain protein